MKLNVCLAASIAALALIGCSEPKAVQQPDAAALTAAGQIVLRAAIRHGVADYVNRHGPEKAARAKELVGDLLVVINSDATTTLDALKALAYSKIPADFSPMDAQDAHDVIDLVAIAIQQYIGNGQLNGKALVDLRDVLGTIAYVIDHPNG